MEGEEGRLHRPLFDHEHWFFVCQLWEMAPHFFGGKRGKGMHELQACAKHGVESPLSGILRFLICTAQRRLRLFYYIICEGMPEVVVELVGG